MITQPKEIVHWMKKNDHSHTDRKEAYIKEVLEELIDECAKIAQETPTGRQIGEILKLKEQIQ